MFMRQHTSEIETRRIETPSSVDTVIISGTKGIININRVNVDQFEKLDTLTDSLRTLNQSCRNGAGGIRLLTIPSTAEMKNLTTTVSKGTTNDTVIRAQMEKQLQSEILAMSESHRGRLLEIKVEEIHNPFDEYKISITLISMQRNCNRQTLLGAWIKDDDFSSYKKLTYQLAFLKTQHEHLQQLGTQLINNAIADFVTIFSPTSPLQNDSTLTIKPAASTTTPLKTIIFDLGNVLLSLHHDRTNTAFQNLTSRNVTEFFNGPIFKRLHQEFERGSINSSEFRHSLRRLLPLLPTVTNQQIDSAWNAMLGNISADHINFITELKHLGYQVVLLSNSNEIHYNYLQTNFGATFNHLFDRQYYSHLLQKAKPHNKIFQHVIRDLLLQPHETLFFDDLLPNVMGAIRAGLHSRRLHVNDSIESFRNEIDRVNHLQATRMKPSESFINSIVRFFSGSPSVAPVKPVKQITEEKNLTIVLKT